MDTTADEPLEFATLLGARGLELSVRCLASLIAAAAEPVRLRLHDDGTLSDDDLDRLRSALPVSRVVGRREADERAEAELAEWPACLGLRRTNVLALKLFDLHWFDTGPWIRYVDSDVLFLRRFRGAPLHFEREAPVFFPDDQSAYSIRVPQLLAPRAPRLPARVNTGLFAIPRHRFDLDAVESFLRRWRGRAPIWIEQTCWAVLAGVEGTQLLSPRQFRIHRPGSPAPPETIALHFVSSVRGDLRGFRSTAPSAADDPIASRIVPAKKLRLSALLIEALRRRVSRRPQATRV